MYLWTDIGVVVCFWFLAFGCPDVGEEDGIAEILKGNVDRMMKIQLSFRR